MTTKARSSRIKGLPKIYRKIRAQKKGELPGQQAQNPSKITTKLSLKLQKKPSNSWKAIRRL
jgi:hypothetical protein